MMLGVGGRQRERGSFHDEGVSDDEMPAPTAEGNRWVLSAGELWGNPDRWRRLPSRLPSRAAGVMECGLVFCDAAHSSWCFSSTATAPPAQDQTLEDLGSLSGLEDGGSTMEALCSFQGASMRPCLGQPVHMELT